MFEDLIRNSGQGGPDRSAWNEAMRRLEGGKLTTGPRMFMRRGPNGTSLWTKPPSRAVDHPRRFRVWLDEEAQKLHVDVGSIRFVARNSKTVKATFPTLNGVSLDNKDDSGLGPGFLIASKDNDQPYSVVLRYNAGVTCGDYTTIPSEGGPGPSASPRILLLSAVELATPSPVLADGERLDVLSEVQFKDAGSGKTMKSHIAYIESDILHPCFPRNGSDDGSDGSGSDSDPDSDPDSESDSDDIIIPTPDDSDDSDSSDSDSDSTPKPPKSICCDGIEMKLELRPVGNCMEVPYLPGEEGFCRIDAFLTILKNSICGDNCRSWYIKIEGPLNSKVTSGDGDFEGGRSIQKYLGIHSGGIGNLNATFLVRPVSACATLTFTATIWNYGANNTIEDESGSGGEVDEQFQTGCKGRCTATQTVKTPPYCGGGSCTTIPPETSIPTDSSIPTDETSIPAEGEPTTIPPETTTIPSEP